MAFYEQRKKKDKTVSMGLTDKSTAQLISSATIDFDKAQDEETTIKVGHILIKNLKILI